MSVQVTLNITEELYHRAQKLARSRDADVTELLAEAIALPPIEEAWLPLDKDQAIEQERKAYWQLHNDLLAHYADQYIALHQGQLVGHHPEFSVLFTQINRDYPHEFVLIRRVESEPEPIYHFRSPRLVKDA